MKINYNGLLIRFWREITLLGLLLFVSPIFFLFFDAAFRWHLGGRLTAFLAGISMLIGLALMVGAASLPMLDSIKIWWDSHKKGGGPENQD